jgi:hypothetical protein
MTQSELARDLNQKKAADAKKFKEEQLQLRKRRRTL